MKIEKRDIFEQVGNLFYSIAADQHVKPLEVGELKSLISKNWLPKNQRESVVSEETHFIIITMDLLEGNRVAAKDAFADFSKFYVLHPEVFSDELKRRMLDTAVGITRVFEADGSFENSQLTALKKLFSFSTVQKI